MAKSDTKEVGQDASVSSKRRFDQRDWNTIAENVIDEFTTRKNERRDLDKCWKDIDRQVCMEPELAFKTLPDGKIDEKKRWMSELELPLQSQALEVLKADARRLMFPDNGSFFRAHAAMTDAYLEKVNFQSLILGDQTEVPTHINQDNCDKLVEGFVIDLLDRTDFPSRIDRI